MTKKLNDHLEAVYDKLDLLRERLEFVATKDTPKNLKLLDDALDELNRYVKVLEKFDKSSKANCTTIIKKKK